MLILKRPVQVQTVFSAFETVYSENFQYVGERHNFWELLYVIEGCAGVVEEDKVYELSPGEIIFYKPMEFHRVWSEKNKPIHIITMSFSILGVGCDSLGDGVFRLNEEKYKLLREALELTCHCVEFDDDIKNQLISNNLERLILRLLEEHTRGSGRRKTIGDGNYKNIIRIMNENINRKLTIEELAKLCSLSTSNLKKTFKKFSGMGVMEYFNRLKMTEAIKLLEEDVSINEISEMLGFSSPGYFSDSFKKLCGKSPSVYRSMYKNSEWYFLNNGDIF